MEESKETQEQLSQKDAKIKEFEAKLAEQEAKMKKYEEMMRDKPSYGAIEKTQPYVTFNNGVKFPMIGLGTCYLTDAEHMRISVVECGYRMLDCASYYKNEDVVG